MKITRFTFLWCRINWHPSSCFNHPRLNQIKSLLHLCIYINSESAANEDNSCYALWNVAIYFCLKYFIKFGRKCKSNKIKFSFFSKFWYQKCKILPLSAKKILKQYHLIFRLQNLHLSNCQFIKWEFLASVEQNRLMVLLNL